MSAATEYLEAAGIDDLESRLAAQGYQVTRADRHTAQGYDLAATRGGERVAFLVHARSGLGGAVQEIQRLREQARANGFTDFRLLVVSPPREVRVQIPDLDHLLAEWMREHTPPEIAGLFPSAGIESVVLGGIDAVTVSADGIAVAGNGVVNLGPGRTSGRDDGGIGLAELPFDFDLLLSHDIRIAQVVKLSIDTSGYGE